jgi:YidC/Oxa1 family membrane protein insertase
MSFLFHSFLYQPLYNILIFLYNVVPGGDFGVAIILTTILLKFLLFPLSQKQIESQKKLQELQPKIKEIQNRNKDNKEKQSKELMDFYKQNKTNPFSGCLPIIVQLFFVIAIYRIIFNISGNNLAVEEGVLYQFVTNPGTVNSSFLGIIDLSKPFIPFAVLAAVAQFFQTKMLMAKQPKKKASDSGEPDFGQIMSKQMLFLGPIMTLFIGIKFAAGLSLYWLISTLFAIVQQAHLNRKEVAKS